ncbi:MAG: hypothetical protein ACRCZ0_09165 [Cetobacterium sp.]
MSSREQDLRTAYEGAYGKAWYKKFHLYEMFKLELATKCGVK